MAMQTYPTIDTPAGAVPETAPDWFRQRRSQMPSHRYRDIHDRVQIPEQERHWPGARIRQAPLWVPVDLRDGNQALAEPMDPGRKLRFFGLLATMGSTRPNPDTSWTSVTASPTCGRRAPSGRSR